MAKSPLYLFIPSNDSMVHSMLPIINHLEKYLFMTLPMRQENADAFLMKEGKEFVHYSPGLLHDIGPSIVILGNDWGREERQIVLEARILKIPSVCIQEGVILLNNDELLNADFIFVQGAEILKHLQRDGLIITGNPKYDDLKGLSFPSAERVMINCNFTYGIFEEVREQWVNDARNACAALNLDYFISRHPRDRGVFPTDYPIIESNAFKIKQQLENSSIVITRYSTVIYEALMAGRDIIYYNPHKENYKLLQGDNSGVFFEAKNLKELIHYLKITKMMRGQNDAARQKFLLQHCGTLDYDASVRCANALKSNIGKEYEHSINLTTNSNRTIGQNLIYRQFVRYLQQIEDLVDSLDWHKGQISNLSAEVETRGLHNKNLETWNIELETGKAWLEEQVSNWQKEAEAQGERIYELERWNTELVTGKAWFEKQVSNWQKEAEAQGERIYELERWNTELVTGKAWLEEQVSNWQKEAKTYEKQIAELNHWIKELGQAKAGLEGQLVNWQTNSENMSYDLQRLQENVLYRILTWIRVLPNPNKSKPARSKG